MELQYKKALEQHKLNVNVLPEDAITGIEQINHVLKAIHMCEKQGKPVKESVYKKLRAMDKWVYYEILDYLHDTDNNDDDIPFDKNDVIDDLDKNKNKKGTEDSDDDEQQPDALGVAIENELDSLYESGKTSYSIEELKNSAKKTYSELFNAYENGGENGITTSKYTLIEDSNKKFNLKLK
jgi:hypothetical protein